MENNKTKSMSPVLAEDNLGDVYESLKTPETDHRCSWMLVVDFQICEKKKHEF